MSKRSSEEIFEKPLKALCTGVNNRITPVFLDRRSPKMDFQTSSISTPDVEFSDGDGIDYFRAIDQAMDQFLVDIQKEDRLLAEVNYNLSTSLLLGTGISMARNCTPAVKIWINNAFSAASEGVSFNSFDWNDFVGRMKSMGDSAPNIIKIGDYTLTSQRFLDEKD